MFTGIIEHIGVIESLALTGAGGRVRIHAPTLTGALAVSKSVAVNGCCLTITEVHSDKFSADLSAETVSKATFGAQGGELKKGARVNLEQPLTAGKEFGGHFVLGHVDDIGRVIELQEESLGSNSWRLAVEVPLQFARYVVPKGSITVDGISLTVANWDGRVVEVAVIPFTYAHTNLRDRAVGDAVNLEADVLGKYIERYLEAREKK
ncbi:MAG: riboflavin synthase [Acidobacteriota bacterium]|nr:riboflavin synthase [Acidobacteriota bacterium]